MSVHSALDAMPSNAIPSNQAPNCPACNTTCAEPPVYRYSAARAASHFCPPERDLERHSRLVRCISRLWNGTESVILRCGSCGFGFGYPFVGGDEEFYGILHEQQGYPGWRWDYDFALTNAVQSRSGGRILDIGAGSGEFLKSLDGRWEKYATEGSEATRTQLEANGIKVYRGLTETLASAVGSFDVITMFQLLEHIADFRELLAQCRDLLRPRGSLVITVPHGDAMFCQEALTGCPDMPPFHINKWTPDSLANVLQQIGFKPSRSWVRSPDQWQNFLGAAHLRILADASRRGSLSAQVYRLKRRSMRIPLLAALAIPATLRMLPHVGQLRRGGTFAMVASA